MPRRPLKLCAKAGCGAKTEGRYCKAHEHIRREYSKQYDQERPSPSKRGYGDRWRKYRVWFLKQHPLCACGCGRPATDVDHIQPVDGPDDPLFWDESNHQGLTHACHSSKTAREKGYGRGT